jgi:hypothetical protein
MKIVLTGLFALLILLPGCAAPQTAIANATPSPVPAVFQTPIGELEHTFTRLVREVNSTTAPSGSMILLVGLRRPDEVPINLQKFLDAHMQIFFQAKGGEEILSIMGGFIGLNSQEFAIGFMVPDEVKSYRLEWEGNPSLEIVPEKS